MCFTLQMRFSASTPRSVTTLPIVRAVQRSLVLAAALVAVLALVAGCSSTSSVFNAPKADASEVSILFSVLAPTMDVVVSGDAFSLSVPASSSTAWFTDRPARNAGSMTVADLVSTWSAQGFATDPPNAAVAVEVNGEQHQHVVELSNPVIAGGMATFRAVDVGDDESTDSVAGRDATHGVVAGHFENAELFIDDATQTPCPSSITSTSSMACLAAANTTVSLTITTQHSVNCVILTRTTKNNETVHAGPSTAEADELSLTTDFPVMIDYATSGEKWKITGTPDPININFGDCPTGA